LATRFKSLQREFATAAWRGRSELRDFLARCAELGAGDLAKLIPLLLPTQEISRARRQARLQAFVELTQGLDEPRLFTPLLRACAHGDPMLRRVTRSLLVRWCQPRHFGELATLLRADEPTLREYALDLFGEIGGGRKALDALAPALREGEPGRIEAMEAAVAVAGHHAIGALAMLVETGSMAERVTATELLGRRDRMGPALRRALEALSPALRDPQAPVLARAVRSYGQLAPEDEFLSLIREYFEPGSDVIRQQVAVRELVQLDGPTIVEELERVLESAPPAVRAVAVEAVQQLDRDDVLPFLERALGDPDLAVRNAALAGVVQVVRRGQLDTDRLLMWLLRSPDLNVKRQAVEVIHQVGEPMRDLGPRLLRMLKDEDWWVRERVVETLVEIAGDELTRHVLTYLDDPSDVIRRYAVGVLRRIKDPVCVGPLLRTARRDEDWWVREQAIECLAEIGDPRAAAPLAELAGKVPELRRSAVVALGRLGSTVALPLLRETLHSEEPDERLAAITALAEIGDPSAAADLERLLDDTDHRIRTAAEETVIRWKSQARTDGARIAGRLSGLELLLWRMTAGGGDDLFLIAGQRPFMKRMGRMVPLHEKVLSPEVVEQSLRRVMTPVQLRTLEERGDVDFSLEVKSQGLRFRANVLRQLSGWTAVFRKVASDILGFDELGLPPIVRRLCDLPQGLVLIGGPTGSGKSTTLAAMIDHINRSRRKHVITIEDPIEVVHGNRRSIVTQREVGSHTPSFAAALRSVLREDPDVILVGEMRDLETISFAVQAAETGHLVLGTIHTVSAETTVDRLIDAFPVRQQGQIRTMLSHNLSAVVCQQLLRRMDGQGRIAAIEVLVVNEAVANIIRKGQCHQLPSVVATHRELGMQGMDRELTDLVAAGEVDREEAYVKALDKKAFAAFLESLGDDDEEWEMVVEEPDGED